MSKRLNDGGGAGLSVLNLMNFKTGEELCGILFKRDRRDKGIMLNVCPWCTSSIMWIERDKSPTRPAPGGRETENASQ